MTHKTGKSRIARRRELDTLLSNAFRQAFRRYPRPRVHACCLLDLLITMVGMLGRRAKAGQWRLLATLGGWASLTQTDYEDELFFGVFETFQPPARIRDEISTAFHGAFCLSFPRFGLWPTGIPFGLLFRQPCTLLPATRHLRLLCGHVP